MKQIDVQIMGQTYVLASPEGGESRLLDAVERVDTAMCKIRDAGKVRARDRIAVLAALNLAFDLADRNANAAQNGAVNSLPAQTALAAGVGMASASTQAPQPANDPETQNNDVVLAGLLQRLDATLGGDGQLI
jgi:cell division protein ZapA